ncbi:MAG: DUF2007 domain-containing protein [Chloroflexi bacterium]|nr:DUF2007 domain-containing protein [Chloroflexota bacterium]
MPGWQPLYVFYDAAVATLAQSFLEAYGIPVFLRQEGVARAMGLYMGPLAHATLLVPEDRWHDAVDLMVQFLRGYDAPVGTWADRD